MSKSVSYVDEGDTNASAIRSCISSRSLAVSAFLAFLPRAIRVWALVNSAKSGKLGQLSGEYGWLGKLAVISLTEVVILTHEAALRMRALILVITRSQ